MMRLKFIFFVIVMMVLTSFISIKPYKPIILSGGSKTQFHSKFLFSDSSGVACFESEDFASEALKNYSIALMKREFTNSLHCSKESFINKHDSAVVDTIYTFSNAENIIQIYSTSENDFIFTFEVTDSIFNLNGNIKPGMTKDGFSKKLQIGEAFNNKVQISNIEGSIQFMFYFENNRLKKINSYLYLD